MSNVFEKVSFYDENNKITKFNGYENKVLLVFFWIYALPRCLPYYSVGHGKGDERFRR
jgi:hypothetical protein